MKNYKFLTSHEWIKVEGNVAKIGISDHAQDTLGEIVFVELPSVGDHFNKGDDFGAVESVKAASELYMPISGTVTNVNEALEDEPELINEDAYLNWIIEIELDDLSELDDLLSYEDYEAMEK